MESKNNRIEEMEQKLEVIRKGPGTDSEKKHEAYRFLADAYRSGDCSIETWAGETLMSEAVKGLASVKKEAEEDPGKKWEPYEFLSKARRLRVAPVSAWAEEQIYEIMHAFAEDPGDVSGFPTPRQLSEMVTVADSYMKATDRPNAVRLDINIILMAFFHSGDEVRRKAAGDIFICRNRGFVGKIIEKHFPTFSKDYYDDMFQQGCLAIIEHMGKYDPRLSPTGSSTSYFTNHVRNSIMEFLNGEFNRSFSAYEARMINKVKRSLSKFEAENITPSVTDIQYDTNLSVKQIEKALDWINILTECSLDDEKTKEAATEMTPEEAAIRMEEKEILCEGLETLGELERAVVEMVYGIPDDNPVTLPVAARSLGINENQARTYLTTGLQMLKRHPRVAKLRTSSGFSAGNPDTMLYDDVCGTRDLYDVLFGGDDDMDSIGTDE